MHHFTAIRVLKDIMMDLYGEYFVFYIGNIQLRKLEWVIAVNMV